MKKSIFDLTFKEGAALDLEIRKTSYYKQYVKGYILAICIAVLFNVGLISGVLSDKSVTPALIMIGTIIVVCFVSLITLIFWFKRFDLMRLYFEEKNKEKN